MNIIYLIIIIIAVAAGFGTVLYQQNRKFRELSDGKNEDKSQEVIMRWMESTAKSIDETRQEMKASLDKNTDVLQTRLGESSKELNKRLDRAAEVIGTVNKSLGEMQEMGRQMKDLQDFLKSPKLRGNMGEQVLRELLEQILPRETFNLQYKFKEGQTVDAIIKTDNGLIPIDSKFPMENFQRWMKAEGEIDKKSTWSDFRRDFRKHIDDIAKKYILPSEGTVDFAVMYLPSETVYYEVVMRDNELNLYAQNKKIFLTSPNSFFYFLRTVMVGLQGKKIEEASKKILETLNTIQQDAKKFDKGLGVLARHVTNAKNSMDSVATEYSQLSGKIDGVKMLRK